MTVRSTWSAAIAVALVASLAGCAAETGADGPVASGADRPPREFLFVAPSSADPANSLPAFRGAEVALAVAVAAQGGLAAELRWTELPADLDGWLPPAAAGAIIAPGTPPETIARLVSLLGVPTVSLAGGPMEGAWRTLAVGDAAIAAAMLAAGGDAPCLVVGADGHAFAAEIRRAAAAGTSPTRLRARDVLRVPALVADCSAILWPGAGESGAALRRRVVGAGYGAAPFVASERLRDGEFESAVGGVGRGVLVVSGATDVATLLDLRSRRFVQDYQAQVGLPPGPYSVEGWDAAALLLEMLREGWPSAFAGVGGRYGLLGRSDPPVITYRLTRAGWRLG